MPLKSSREHGDQIDSFLMREDFEGLAAYFAELEQTRPLDVPELLLKSRAIQLADNPPYDLPDARNALEEVLRRDPGNLRALIDLGWFDFAVQDDAKAAARTFELAIERATELLREARKGLAEAQSELRAE